MSQTSPVLVQNGTGLAFRTQLNQVIPALGSDFSGASAPADTFSGMRWRNTSDGKLYLRSEDNTAWNVDVAYANIINPSGVVFTGGTINGVAIGGTSPSSAKFTTVNASGQITSTVTTGAAPFVVSSTTPVANLSIGGNAATATDATNATHATSADFATTATNATFASGVVGSTWEFPGPHGTSAPSFGTVYTNTIATLRTCSKLGPQVISTIGAAAILDGGGRSYALDSSDTSSADNGTTIIVANDGARWKAISPAGSTIASGVAGSTWEFPGPYGTSAPSFGNVYTRTIATLRTCSKTGPQVISTIGYNNLFDGGGNTYALDSSDTSSVDNGVTVIVSADGGRWKAINPAMLTAKQVGATGGGSVDDAPLINAAMTIISANGGGVLRFTPGVYRLKSSIQYKAGVNMIGDGMGTTTLLWWPDSDVPGAILNTANQSIQRAVFSNLRFARNGSITSNVTGILGGSTLANYNSAIATFENLHFDMLAYPIRGNAEPTGVGIFDCTFKNVWCSGCAYGLWLFGSSNVHINPRVTNCDIGIALDYLNAESYDSCTVIGGTFVSNHYDIGVISANGIRPTKIIGTWFEQSTYGIINVQNAGARCMNLSFIDCMLSTSATTGSLFNVANAVGTITLDRCTLISGGAGTTQALIEPSSSSGRLIVKDCQQYDSASAASLVTDNAVFAANKNSVDQSVPASTYTKLTWATATIDTAGGFDNANDTYIVPRTAYYNVKASIAVPAQASAALTFSVLLYKNSSLIKTMTVPSAVTNFTISLDAYVKCSKGDTLEVRFWHNAASSVNVSGATDLTAFTVTYQRPA